MAHDSMAQLSSSAVALAFLLVACGAQEPQADPSAVAEMAGTYTAAWGSQDPARVAAHYAPEGSLQINAGAPAVGRDAITAAAQAFMTSLPDMVVVMDSLVGNDGRTAVYHWTLTGTNTGPGGTGRAVRISGYEEWTLTPEARIAQSLGHFDEAEYARQLQAEAPNDTT